ncbi:MULTISPECIES: hypothetical protein [unclassified Lysinibacillus]|uniref:hypothetical protein n=1 Tax=unclassified Lysinibacillus TaxID=2636778 RepID=UPI00087E49D7|nr:MULTISPECIES: hypothetical protein [unclassified Lysinibacillus]SCY87289.1 hypothetical protein SAMN02787078_02816 [Lysinibacillus sp. SG9]SDB38392.1 hypothetical protein SAMN02787079_02856 [Lysinibacillus sp. TC-37]SFT02426.1 hypothetical protein SAMN02787087_03111 [Lysinibacillus sp. SG55]
MKLNRFLIVVLSMSLLTACTIDEQIDSSKESIPEEEKLEKVAVTAKPEEVNYYKTVTLPYYEEVIAEFDSIWQLYWQDSAEQFSSGGMLIDYLNSLKELTDLYKALQLKLNELPTEHLIAGNVVTVQQAAKDLNICIEKRLEANSNLLTAISTGKINDSKQLEIQSIVAEGDKLLISSNSKMYGLAYDLGIQYTENKGK